jgi:hypothetical protein
MPGVAASWLAAAGTQLARVAVLQQDTHKKHALASANHTLAMVTLQ